MIGQIASGISGVTATTANKDVTSEAGGAMPFAGVLKDMVNENSALSAQASQAVTGLMSGQGVDIHDAMMATQKASLSFELALQVRNKAVGAYQQMMGMQF